MGMMFSQVVLKSLRTFSESNLKLIHTVVVVVVVVVVVMIRKKHC
jgi:hypothetical protein